MFAVGRILHMGKVAFFKHFVLETKRKHNINKAWDES